MVLSQRAGPALAGLGGASNPRELTRSGMAKFIKGDVAGSIADFDKVGPTRSVRPLNTTRTIRTMGVRAEVVHFKRIPVEPPPLPYTRFRAGRERGDEHEREVRRGVRRDTSDGGGGCLRDACRVAARR